MLIPTRRVEVTSQWNPDEASKEEILVGFVSGVGGGRGVAYCDDQEVSFPCDMFGMGSGYRPHVNDWVKVGVAYIIIMFWGKNCTDFA